MYEDYLWPKFQLIQTFWLWLLPQKTQKWAKIGPESKNFVVSSC